MVQPYRRVPNFNLVPKELRPRKRTALALIVALSVLLAMSFAYSSRQATVEKNDLRNEYQIQLTQLEPKLPEARAKLSEAASIRKETETLNAQASGLKVDFQALSARKVNWSKLLADVMSTKPADVTLVSVSLDGTDAKLLGQAAGIEGLLAYRAALGQSSFVANVAEFKTLPVPGNASLVGFEMSLRVYPGGR